MTRSTSRTRSSNPTRSSTVSTPERNSAPSANSAAPRPPAAPAPGTPSTEPNVRAPSGVRNNPGPEPRQLPYRADDRSRPSSCRTCSAPRRHPSASLSARQTPPMRRDALRADSRHPKAQRYERHPKPAALAPNQRSPPAQGRQDRGRHRSPIIDHTRAQRLQHAGAAVVGGAAAQANIDSLCTRANRMKHQFAHAIGRSRKRRRLRARRVPMPAASAISMTADSRSTSTSIRAGTRSPKGPATSQVTSSPPQAATASSVPSPPSASGNVHTSASGQTRRTPSATAASACALDTLPLKESIANSTRRGRRHAAPKSTASTAISSAHASASHERHVPQDRPHNRSQYHRCHAAH